MTNILIINLHSSHNAGDAALTSVAVQQLRAAFPGARLTLAMNDPASYVSDTSGHVRVVGSFMYWLQAVSETGQARWQMRELFWLPLAYTLALLCYGAAGWRVYPLLNREQRDLLDAYLDADLVVSAPGNFLYHSGRLGLPFLVAVLSMVVALVLRKPLYTMPQSIGPLRRWWEGLLVRAVLRRARLVLVREPATVTQLRRIGAWWSHCHLLPDLAFAFEGVEREQARHWLQVQGADRARDRPLIGVTLINWSAQYGGFGGQTGYETAFCMALHAFVKQYGGKVLCFPQVCGPAYAEDDRVVARRVAAQLRAVGVPALYIDGPVAPEVLKSAYGEMDLFIGTRMHSNIFALAEEVPTLAVGYRFKTQGIMHMVGLEHQVIDITKVDAGRLHALIDATWANRAALRSHIRREAAECARQAASAATLIARDVARAGANA
jgi:colanic acid/amylovoran biosynthesis protein